MYDVEEIVKLFHSDPDCNEFSRNEMAALIQEVERLSSISSDLAGEVIAWREENNRLREELAHDQETINDLTDRCGRLEKELAEAQKDAARYRWLRTHPLTMGDGTYVVWKPDTLDAAIDAAMAQEKP